MRYFCTEAERVNTCYHEFQRGWWDGKSFWKSDSLLMHDDIFYALNMKKLFKDTIPGYDYYGETSIDQSQWLKLKEAAEAYGEELKAALGEAEDWVRENFKKEDVFTILGL